MESLFRFEISRFRSLFRRSGDGLFGEVPVVTGKALFGI